MSEPERPNNQAEASRVLRIMGFTNMEQRVKLLNLWDRYKRGEFKK